MKAKRIFFTILGILVYLFICFGLLPVSGLPKLGGSYQTKIHARFEVKREEGGVTELDDKPIPIQEILNQTRARFNQELQFESFGEKVIEVSFNQDLLKRDYSIASQELEYLIKSIEAKPSLIMTDAKGRPLFFRGFFAPQSISNFLKDSTPESLFSPPLSANSIEPSYNQEQNQHLLTIKAATSFAEAELAKAKIAALDRVSEGENKIYLWLNYRKLLKQISQEDEIAFKLAGENPIKYLKVADGEQQQDYHSLLAQLLGYAKPEQVSDFKVRARGYLVGIISINAVNANTPFAFPVEPSSGRVSKQLTNLINFSKTNYRLKHLYTYLVPTKGVGAFNYLLILLLLLALALLLFLISYRLLGLVSSLSLATTLSLNLVFQSLSNIPLTPLTSLLLILALISVCFDNINLLERFKYQVSLGLAARLALSRVSRQTLVEFSRFNFIAALFALILFYQSDLEVSYVGQLLITLCLVNLILIALPLRLALISFNNLFSFDNWARWSGISKTKPRQISWAGGSIATFKAFVIVRAIINLLLIALGITLIVIAATKVGNKIGFNLGIDFATKELLIANFKNGSWEPLRLDSKLELNSLLRETGSILDNNNYSLELVSLKDPYLPDRAFLSLRGFGGVFSNEQLTSLELLFKSRLGQDINLLNSDFSSSSLVEKAGSFLNIYLLLLAILCCFKLFERGLSTAFIFLSTSFNFLIIGLCFYGFSRVGLDRYFWLTISLVSLFNSQFCDSLFTRIRQGFKRVAGHPNYVFTPNQVGYAIKQGYYISLKQLINILLFCLTSALIFLAFNLDNYYPSLALFHLFIGGGVVNLGLAPRVIAFYSELKNSIKATRLRFNFWESQNPSEEIFEGINDFNY